MLSFSFFFLSFFLSVFLYSLKSLFGTRIKFVCMYVCMYIVGVLHQSLDLSNRDNVMLWAACCLGFFGFLQAGRFTTNSSFNPSVDLTPADLQVDSSLNHKALEFSLSALRLICFGVAASFSWVVVLHLSVLFQH